MWMKIFRVDIGTPQHKTSRDEQFPKIEFPVNCKVSHGTKDLQGHSKEILILCSCHIKLIRDKSLSRARSSHVLHKLAAKLVFLHIGSNIQLYSM